MPTATDPTTRPPRRAWWLLGLAGGLFGLALLLPFDGRERGGEVLFRILRLIVDNPEQHFDNFLRAAVLQASAGFVVAGVLLAVGLRTAARVLASGAFVVAWAVGGYFAVKSRDLGKEVGYILTRAPSIPLWYASLSATAAATFVRPRRPPADGHDTSDEGAP